VMATTVGMPASTASRMAVGGEGGGTKIIVASAPVFSHGLDDRVEDGSPRPFRPVCRA